MSDDQDLGDIVDVGGSRVVDDDDDSGSSSSTSTGGRRTNIGSGSTGGRGSVDRTDPSSVPSSSGGSTSSPGAVSQRARDLTRGAGPTLDESETVTTADVESVSPPDSGGSDTDSDSRGTIADARVPGTDSTVLDVADRADSAFQERVVEPAAGLGRDAGEADLPVGPGGAVEGSDERGQLGADFGRSAAQAVNVPGFVAGALRAGPEIAQTQGDPERARRGVEAGAELGGEAAGFAADNPLRAGAMTGGFLAGAGAATGAARVAGRATGRSRTQGDDIVDAADTSPQPQPGTGGTGTVLDPSDIRQPASQPTGSASGVDRIRRELDDLLGDQRGQLGAGRQRQRPDDGGGGGSGSGPSRPTSDELLEGSPRDRIGDDIMGRQRQALDDAQGTFDGAGDPIAPRGGGGRGTSPGSRIPRDPLDTRGGRTSDGTGLGLTDAAVAGGATGQSVGGLLDSPAGGAETGDFLGADDGTAADPTPDVGDILVGDGTQTGTETGTGAEETVRSGLGLRESAVTGQREAQQQRTGGRQRASPARTFGDPFGGLRDAFGDPTVGDGGRPGRPTPGSPRPRTRRGPPRVGVSDGEDELLEIDSEFDDALIDSGIADAEDLLDSDDSAFRF